MSTYQMKIIRLLTILLILFKAQATRAQQFKVMYDEVELMNKITKVINDSFRIVETIADTAAAGRKEVYRYLKNMFYVDLDMERDRLSQFTYKFDKKDNAHPGFQLKYLFYADQEQYEKAIKSLRRQKRGFIFFSLGLPDYFEAMTQDNLILIIYSHNDELNFQVMKVLKEYGFKDIGRK